MQHQAYLSWLAPLTFVECDKRRGRWAFESRLLICRRRRRKAAAAAVNVIVKQVAPFAHFAQCSRDQLTAHCNRFPRSRRTTSRPGSRQQNDEIERSISGGLCTARLNCLCSSAFLIVGSLQRDDEAVPAWG